MNTESQNIELKESWRDEYLKWICGFANAQGGTLYIGVCDNGKVCGVREIKKLMEDIPNKVRDLMGILVDVNLRTEGDKEYLAIVTDSYPYPISYKGRYYQRSGATNQELKGVALDRFMLRKQGRTWDGVPVPIQVRVYDNALEILDCGVLPDNWSVETLLGAHGSHPYNPDIANTFFRAGEIEAWGRGIERIVKACQEGGFSTPEFRYDASGIWTVFKFVYPSLDSALDTSQKTNQKTNQKIDRNLTDQQNDIIKYLREHPYATQKELCENIPNAALGGIRHNLARLQELGILKRIGGRKLGHWEIA